MADKRCFVQFPHPGKECDVVGGRTWNETRNPHRRKFMQLCGRWTTGNGVVTDGNLWAWGEWEPESKLLRMLSGSGNDPLMPRNLWKPYYVPKSNYRGLHNTDPFIFGDCFLYSNCRQSAENSAGLRHLGRGSVIAFGSGKEIEGDRRWMLDTVFVVRDYFDYEMREARTSLEGQVPDTFLEVTGGPLSDYDGQPGCWGTCVSGSDRLRLYRGATPDDPVHGMFSFFPAMRANGDRGFARPLVDLPSECFSAGNWRAAKGLRMERHCEELVDLWERLVQQVRDNQLVLGTRAQLPECRPGDVC